jgi:hypothetical protein
MKKKLFSIFLRVEDSIFEKFIRIRVKIGKMMYNIVNRRYVVQSIENDILLKTV